MASGAQFGLLSAVTVPHDCTDLFVVASVLLDTVNNIGNHKTGAGEWEGTVERGREGFCAVSLLEF